MKILVHFCSEVEKALDRQLQEKEIEFLKWVCECHNKEKAKQIVHQEEWT